jgi:hypothetical protein
VRDPRHASLGRRALLLDPMVKACWHGCSGALSTGFNADPAGVNQHSARIVIADQQRGDKGRTAFGLGPADDDKFLPVEAFGLEPKAVIAGAVGGIQPLRNNPLKPERSGTLMKYPTLADLVVAIADCFISEPGAGQQTEITAIEPGVHAIAVKFELMGPFVAALRFSDQPSELGLDPGR